MLNRDTYRLSRAFPPGEAFALTAQVRRSSTSVAANIAEGAGRNSDPDFARFLEQAYGSLMETASHLYLALDEGYVDEATLAPVLDRASGLAGRIVVLNHSLEVARSKTPFARPARQPTSTLDSRPSTPVIE